MDLQQKVQVSLTVLLTGLVVVFLMLILLTLIIKGYGSAVTSITAKLRAKREKRVSKDGTALKAATETVKQAEVNLPAETADVSIPAEVVAAISAAVYCMMPGSSIRSLKRAPRQNNTGCSAWNMAGRFNNTRPF